MPTVNVTYDKNFLQFLSRGHAKAQIDQGKLFTVPRNCTISVDVTAGSHHLKIWVPYMGTDSGIAEVSFETEESETVSFNYRMPMFVMMSGSLVLQRGEAEEVDYGPY